MLQIIKVWKCLVTEKFSQTLENLRMIGTKLAKHIVKTEQDYSDELQDMMVYGDQFKNWVTTLENIRWKPTHSISLAPSGN
jgi:hypothetical protein